MGEAGSARLGQGRARQRAANFRVAGVSRELENAISGRKASMVAYIVSKHGAVSENVLVFEALSKREMEVLEGMAAMLPTEEIAATLYVSVNTVKTHVRSILRKLSASRRNEAVRRARSLGLI